MHACCGGAHDAPGGSSRRSCRAKRNGCPRTNFRSPPPPRAAPPPPHPKPGLDSPPAATARAFSGAPAPAVASRTSPTNLGLYLLASATARDFGWLGTLELLDRLEPTLATMERLPRVRGHYLNWYDTRTLERLEPQYVSTVDSGNLAG